MSLPLVPPRQVRIGDAASFVGTTPRAIRHYHAIGLLPEPERGGDGRRRYGYEEIVRLLWIRAMAGAGIALDDIRDAFTDAAPAPTTPTSPVSWTGWRGTSSPGRQSCSGSGRPCSACAPGAAGRVCSTTS